MGSDFITDLSPEYVSKRTKSDEETEGVDDHNGDVHVRVRLQSAAANRDKSLVKNSSGDGK